MLLPEYLTFTGVDDRTNLDELKAIHIKYPKNIEWGVLLSADSKNARYPSVDGFNEIIDYFIENNITYAIHLCGKIAREAVWEKNNKKEYIKAFNNANTIQINGGVESNQYVAYMNNLFNNKIVLQTKYSFDSEKYRQLFDQSEGRGKEVVKVSVPNLKPNKLVGYAGGISYLTIFRYIRWINKTVDSTKNCKYWLDMESNVRTNNWFDLEKINLIADTLYYRPKRI